VPTTRAEEWEAIELAVVVLSAINPGAGRREDFVGATGLDPALVDGGRGRRAARVLAGVVAALQERAERSEISVSDAQETA